MNRLAPSGPPVPAATPTTRWLDLDAGPFRENFDVRPFVVGHRLADHPLFAIPRLLELARTLPAKNVEYNRGSVPIDCDPKNAPANGLSVEETIRQIAECKSWLVLKYVDADPEYGALLAQCLAEVAAHSELLRPGMCQPEAFVFVTSPESVTPYHMDPEHNFLLQIRGPKEMHVFDRSVVSAEELERFYGGAHRNMKYQDSFAAHEKAFVLQPGMGLHVPVCAPHWVKNGPEVSVSFSITFRTPDLEKRSLLHNANAYLRARGLSPKPAGASAWRDALKVTSARVARKARALLGRG